MPIAPFYHTSHFLEEITILHSKNASATFVLPGQCFIAFSCEIMLEYERKSWQKFMLNVLSRDERRSLLMNSLDIYMTHYFSVLAF